MKKFISLSLACLMLLPCLLLGGCAGRRPKLDDIYDRVVFLVEASYELNVVFYGEGLPYYDRNLPIYASLYSDYETQQYTRTHNVVSSQAKYLSIEEIKYAAELVYTKELLEQTVYPAAFDGLMVASGGKSEYSPARYIQSNEDLYILNKEPTYNIKPLVYDYSTMKIINPSNGKSVLISITVWEEGKPESAYQTQIKLAKVDGIWYLDKLTV